MYTEAALVREPSESIVASREGLLVAKASAEGAAEMLFARPPPAGDAQDAALGVSCAGLSSRVGLGLTGASKALLSGRFVSCRTGRFRASGETLLLRMGICMLGMPLGGRDSGQEAGVPLLRAGDSRRDELEGELVWLLGLADEAFGSLIQALLSSPAMGPRVSATLVSAAGAAEAPVESLSGVLAAVPRLSVGGVSGCTWLPAAGARFSAD